MWYNGYDRFANQIADMVLPNPPQTEREKYALWDKIS